jgi:hypothetical protein
MRNIMLALLALGLSVALVDTAEARQKKPGQQQAKSLQAGKEVKGKLVKVDHKRKVLEVQTAQGLVKVPVKGKLMVQKGQKGRPVPHTLRKARRHIDVEVIIIIRGGTVIIIIVRV